MRVHSGNGSIGDRATGIIAQFVMIWWVKKFKKRLEALGIEVDLLERFVDDINIVCDSTQPGAEYSDGQLTVDIDKIEEDEEKGEDARTMEVIQKIANDINGMIQLTIDAPSKHEDGKMPVLDLKVWLSSDKEIEYIFYEKPMKSMLVIGKESALPFNIKMKSLTQEVFKRLHNTRMTQMEGHRTLILTKFLAKLKASGYTALDILKVLEGGFNTFNRIKKLEEGKRLFYRPPSIREKERKKMKKSGLNPKRKMQSQRNVLQ